MASGEKIIAFPQKNPSVTPTEPNHSGQQIFDSINARIAKKKKPFGRTVFLRKRRPKSVDSEKAHILRSSSLPALPYN